MTTPQLHSTEMYGSICYSPNRRTPRIHFADCAQVFTLLYDDPRYPDKETYDHDTMPPPWMVRPASRWSRHNPCAIELLGNPSAIDDISISEILRGAMEIIQRCHLESAGGLIQVGHGKGFRVVLHSRPTYVSGVEGGMEGISNSTEAMG